MATNKSTSIPAKKVAKKAAKKVAKKAVKKSANKKPDLTEKNFVEMVGTDPRNSIVRLKKFAKGFLLTNTRTGHEETIAAFTKAADKYNHQINNLH